MAGAGIPIISPVLSVFGGKTKEQQAAEEQMDRQQKALDRMNQERIDFEKAQASSNAVKEARKKQRQASTQGTGRADTILTSPLGEVASAGTAKKTILGG